MSRKILVGGLIVLTGAALVTVNLLFDRSDAAEVDVEAIQRRDLEAIVSAPGTIQPQLSVDMSASTMGRVTRLAVDEGERVTAGQFLLQIDPENLQALVSRGEASLEAAVAGHAQARVAVETARVGLDVARENLERQAHLWSLRLVSREIYEQAVADVELRETELRAREVDVEGAAQRILQERATLDSARYDLTQVTITSPIDGIVTRRNIEEGETVVIGTMNNPGTVLLTIADFSVLEAEIEVDETDIAVASMLRHSPAPFRVMFATTQCVCSCGSRLRLARCRKVAATMPCSFTRGRRRVAGSQPRVCNSSASTRSSAARTASSCARITRRSPCSSAARETDFGSDSVMSSPGRCWCSPSRMRPRRMPVPGTWHSRTVLKRFGETCRPRPNSCANAPCQKLALRCSGSPFA